MATRVRELLQTVRRTLQETQTEGVRWTNAELVEYLNDAYRFLIEQEPEAFADNSVFECAAGPRQELPVYAVRLMNVTRNLEGRQLPLMPTDSAVLNAVRPNWMAETATNQQEFFLYDDRDPKRFYVYPPATAGSLLELVCAMEPQKHLLSDYEDNETLLRVNDRYYPALMNYILYRAYDKDADDAGNFQRSQTYMAGAYNALGVKLQNSMRVSPNA